MIEYYGWINLSDSTYESDDQEKLSIANKVASYMETKKMSASPGFSKIHRVNGAIHLLVSGNANRLRQDVTDVFDLYHYISAIAKGSYGLLYVRNDDPGEMSNEFGVYVLARGHIKKEHDPFLSPCIPVIEDNEI